MKYLNTWFRFNENADDGVFSTKTTGMSYYDSILNKSGRVGYMYWEKGLEGEIEYMSPEEYLKRVREGFKSEVDSGLFKDSQNKIKKAIKQGEKIDMPVLLYGENRFEQEGRNRAMVAIELGLKKIPVFVGREVSYDMKREKACQIIDETIESLKNQNIETNVSNVLKNIREIHGGSVEFYIRYHDDVIDYIKQKV